MRLSSITSAFVPRLSQLHPSTKPCQHNVSLSSNKAAFVVHMQAPDHRFPKGLVSPDLDLMAAMTNGHGYHSFNARLRRSTCLCVSICERLSDYEVLLSVISGDLNCRISNTTCGKRKHILLQSPERFVSLRSL